MIKLIAIGIGLLASMTSYAQQPANPFKPTPGGAVPAPVKAPMPTMPTPVPGMPSGMGNPLGGAMDAMGDADRGKAIGKLNGMTIYRNDSNKYEFEGSKPKELIPPIVAPTVPAVAVPNVPSPVKKTNPFGGAATAPVIK